MGIKVGDTIKHFSGSPVKVLSINSVFKNSYDEFVVKFDGRTSDGVVFENLTISESDWLNHNKV